MPSSLFIATIFRIVDETILAILRQRMLECTFYYGQDVEHKCRKEIGDLRISETHYFAKCKCYIPESFYGFC